MSPGFLMALFGSENKTSDLRPLGFLASGNHTTICYGSQALCSREQTQPDLPHQPSLYSTKNTANTAVRQAGRKGGKSRGWSIEADHLVLTEFWSLQW